MAIDTESLSLILTSSILWVLIYCPIIIYHLRKYQSRETNIVYLLRFSNITIIQSILLIIKLVFSVFTAASGFYIFDQHTLEDDIVNAVNAYLAALFLYCFVWKFWLLRFNIMLNNIVINCEWKSIINPKKYIASNTFYAKYRETFGNTYTSGIICLIIAITFTTMYVITHIIYPEFYGNSRSSNSYIKELYGGWDYALPFVFLLIIYIKTPKFEDNFYITQEMKYIFICLCIQYTIYYLWLLIMSGVTYNSTSLHGTLIEDIILFIEFQIIVGVQFIAMLISTYWVNQKCENIIATHRYEIHKISSKLQLNLKQKHCVQIKPNYEYSNHKINHQSSDINGGIIDHSHHTFDSSNESYFFNSNNYSDKRIISKRSDTFREDLYDILSNEMYYNEFMLHLSKEFSIECLLSLTEFVQFRQYMLSLYDNIKGRTGGNYSGNISPITATQYPSINIRLPLTIPQSYIVFNKQFSNKEKVWKLWAKYIKNGSEFEINLSSEQRNKYNKLMNNFQLFIENNEISDKELIDLFVPCCEQMIYLMVDSKKRFEDTPQYYKLTQITSLQSK